MRCPLSMKSPSSKPGVTHARNATKILFGVVASALLLWLTHFAWEAVLAVTLVWLAVLAELLRRS